MNRSRIFLLGAWITISRLFGGLIAGLLLGSAVFELLPGSSVENPSPAHTAIAAVPAVLGVLGGGAAWGTALGRMAGYPDARRAAWVGVAAFGPIASVTAIGLGTLEPQIFALVGPSIPIHRLFTILFTGSAVLITGTSVFVATRWLGLSLSPGKLAMRTALAAAGTFLAVNLVMEALGWVVGAPGAANRATMLVVMFLGNLAAAFSAGGLLALALSAQQDPIRADARPSK